MPSNFASAFESLEIPTRENPSAGHLYNRLVESFPLLLIEDDDTHKKAKELFLNLLRYKKDPLAVEAEKLQINGYMRSLKLLISEYENRKYPEVAQAKPDDEPVDERCKKHKPWLADALETYGPEDVWGELKNDPFRD